MLTFHYALKYTHQVIIQSARILAISIGTIRVSPFIHIRVGKRCWITESEKIEGIQESKERTVKKE